MGHDSYRLLIGEDDPATADAITGALKNLGHDDMSVEVASNLEQIKTKLQTMTPDVFIIDIGLNYEDDWKDGPKQGLRIIEELKNCLNPRTKVIGLSQFFEPHLDR